MLHPWPCEEQNTGAFLILWFHFSDLLASFVCFLATQTLHVSTFLKPYEIFQFLTSTAPFIQRLHCIIANWAPQSALKCRSCAYKKCENSLRMRRTKTNGMASVQPWLLIHLTTVAWFPQNEKPPKNVVNPFSTFPVFDFYSFKLFFSSFGWMS